jgi:GGDEF domain-containing protein
LDWSKLPDLAAVALLAIAFAAVARSSQASVSKLWLTGWLMIALHFGASAFDSAPGVFGTIADFVAAAALTWAGVLFMWASVPYRNRLSSRWMFAVLLGTNTLYIAITQVDSAPSWALTAAAALFGVLPLAVALMSLGEGNHLLRWVSVALYCALTVFLLIVQHRPGDGMLLALNGVLFAVYFGCCLHFLYAYRRGTTGAFITIAGFLAWSAVFVVGPSIGVFFPNVKLESEVWNLPKYVVAVGMILLILEEQIEHNKYLALHDELTGLPNRRLFQDRLTGALGRARRNGTCTALLLVSDRVRRSDTVARTGGDEFTIILDDPITRADAERVGKSLVELLQEPIDLGNQKVQVGASVGVAVFPEDASDEEGLCIAADVRMYGSKRRRGRSGEPKRPAPATSLSSPEVRAQSRRVG